MTTTKRRQDCHSVLNLEPCHAANMHLKPPLLGDAAAAIYIPSPL